MAEGQRIPDPSDEQHAPGRSPVEEEIATNEPGTPTPRDGIMIFGYSLSIVLVAVFILFLIAVVIAVLVS